MIYKFTFYLLTYPRAVFWLSYAPNFLSARASPQTPLEELTELCRPLAAFGEGWNPREREERKREGDDGKREREKKREKPAIRSFPLAELSIISIEKLFEWHPCVRLRLSTRGPQILTAGHRDS